MKKRTIWNVLLVLVLSCSLVLNVFAATTTETIENEDGTFTEVEGSDTLYPANSVIISISQGPQNAIVSTTTGLNANARGLLIADEDGRTSRPGIFASGDVVNGARTVVEAVAYSKRVAEAMHEYIQSTLEKE